MNRSIIAGIVLAGLLAVSFARAAEECEDGFCPLPLTGEATLKVLSPVPDSAV